MKRVFNSLKIKGILCIPVFLFALNMKAQDIQFSQFYAAALYQNPAFAGATHHDRFSFHQRLQWPGIDAKYTTSLFSYDTYISKHRSGIGIMAYKDWQGSGTINSTDLALQYAYELHVSRTLSFRPGLQLSYVSRNLDYATLTLPQDYDSYYGFVGGSNLQGNSRIHYADVSAGGIAYSDKIWIGFSAHHMNRPNQSFIKGVSRLPTKFAFTGGYKIIVKKNAHHTIEYLDHDKEFSITPSFHYKFQGESDQLDLGVYGLYDFLLVGVWYRGIPVKYYERKLQNSESMIAMIGWKYEQLTVTYSYDFTVSRLVRARTGGSHELNVTYIYKKRKQHKPMKRLPCPNFNHR